jgi:aquaporin Z
VISFVLMLTILLCLSSKRLEHWTGPAAGVLIGLYIAFESPLSGMSMNPARTFGSALTAGRWEGIWIYFTAPPLAALMAAQVFNRFGRGLMPDHQEGPHYPVRDPETGEPAK